MIHQNDFCHWKLEPDGELPVIALDQLQTSERIIQAS